MEPTDESPVSPAYRTVFLVLVALLSTLVSYRYGVGNQLEQLPAILNRMDPGFLAADPFVQTAAQFGPRYYFVELLAWAGTIVPLSMAYLIGTFLTDLALLVVTVWAAGRIFGCDRMAALVSGVLVLGVSGFHLGDATQIRYEVFQPASLALPGAVLAVALGILGRPLAAVAVAVAISVFHPIYGAHAGLLALGTSFISLLIVGRQSWVSAILRVSAATVLFAGALYWMWWLPFQMVNADFSLSSEQLFDILGRFRAPHHYLPSHFRPADFVATAAFAAATALAYRAWRASNEARPYRLVILVPILGVVIGCLAGWLFSEIWPLAIVLSVQPFRLLSVLKWIGLVLMGWYFTRLWRAEETQGRTFAACSCLTGGAAYSLVTLAVLTMDQFLGRRLPSKLLIAAAVLATAALWVVAGSMGETIFLAASFCLLIAFDSRGGWARWTPALVPVAVLGIIGLNIVADRNVPVRPLDPLISFDDLHSPQANIARAAARHTGGDALFVVPPDLGEIRTVGGRATVTDFKLIPFPHRAMADWEENVRLVYGNTELGGFPALADLTGQYRAITDQHLRMIADTLGADHAILFIETDTALPELFRDDSYKIVQITRPAN